MAASVLISACGGAPESSGDKDSLVVAQMADAKTLDPHATNDQTSSRVTAQLFSQLVEIDHDMNIIPGLAKSWEQVDDYATVFHLREGVKFHNGEEMKASDVKFSFDRMMASPSVAHIVGALDRVEIIDEYTVKIVTKYPFGPLLYHLAHTSSSILSEKAVKKEGDNFGQHPVGTGPFKIDSWAAGDRIVLAAFDDYYGGKQDVEKVVFRNVPEGTNRAIGLETGEIDIAYDISAIDKDVVRNDKRLALAEEESLSQAYVGFNVNKAPFNNVKVRQAVAYALNPNDVIDAVLLGSGIPSNSPIGPKVFGYNPNAKQYHQNLEKARELLKEAGYPNGFKTSIWMNDTPGSIQTAQVLQAQLRKVGIDMAIEVTEWGAFLDGTSRGEHEMFMMGWVSVTGDADYGLYALFSSKTHGGAGNRSFYSNPVVDELLIKARQSTDQQQRQKLYAELQNVLQEEVPIISLYYQYYNAGMQKNVEGFSLLPTGHYKIRGVHFSS